MEFDTGPDVQPGHDITIDTASGSQDLGQATYDSDHDGVADSVIVIDGDHEYVITDSDHDGRADSMHEFDSSGHEVDPKTGAPIDSTGTDSTGTDTTGTDTGAGAADHTASTDSGSTSGSARSDHDITVIGDDGSAHSLGAPTIDMDLDGSPDTAIVHNDDGSVTGYTDRDGDGNADQITQISADGKVVIAIGDGHGGWKVAGTGHLDDSGSVIPDRTPDPSGSLDGTDSDGVTTGTGHTSTGTTDHPGTAGSDHPGTAGSDHPSTAGSDHPGGATEPIPDHAPMSGYAPTGDIIFSDGGQDYDLGRPTTDLDGDGTPDTVVTHRSDGSVVGYTDTDGDGRADQVTQISPDGQVVIGVSDGHGGWEQVATGHLDTDGRFVPDDASDGFPAASATG